MWTFDYKAGKGHCARCSCGWVDESPFRPGGPMIRTWCSTPAQAQDRWAQHVREATS